MKIGILTGGGDCPGLNAAIRAIVKRGSQLGDQLWGIKRGWAGLLKNQMAPLTDEAVSGILPKGGTILGTSRTNPTKQPQDIKSCLATMKRRRLDAIIAIGGEDTLGAAATLSRAGLKVIGIPKTIDNDLAGTEYNIGFDTAVTTAMDALDKLHSTAESHERVMILEVMGRHSGWIATVAGMAGGADFIAVPEIPYDIEEIASVILKRRKRGRNFSLIVVAEGARELGRQDLVTQDTSRDAFGHVRLGGVGNLIAQQLEKRLGLEARVTVLGHIQRGGTPTTYDRFIATRLGLKAIELAHRRRFGRMAAVKGNQIVDLPLARAAEKTRTLDLALYREAQIFFG